VLNYNPTGWFIIAGDTVEKTLEEEEALCKRLSEVNEGKALGGFIATSQYIPSLAKQKKSYEAAGNLLPLAPVQYEMLGYDAALASQTGKAGCSQSCIAWINCLRNLPWRSSMPLATNCKNNSPTITIFRRKSASNYKSCATKTSSNLARAGNTEKWPEYPFAKN